MPLTDTIIRNAKLYDEWGLFLIVTPSVGKWWRFRYKWAGKEKLLSLGTYQDI